MGDFRPAPAGSPPALVLGYAQMPEPTIRAGVRELAKAVHAARQETSGFRSATTAPSSS
jgi:DNA-binding transcriptional MocR family regulator